MEVKYQLNKLEYDEFGRPSGVLLLDKKPGITAHDLVYAVRRKLSFQKVGHAGALDVFSSGLMIILVGKATKMSDKLMGMDKEYEAKMVLGISTETQDTEGKIVDINPNSIITENEIESAIKSFLGGYDQYVSIFSSVKVDGKKLRKVLRDKRYTYSVRFNEAGEKIIEIFKDNGEKLVDEIKIPRRKIDLTKLDVLKIEEVLAEKLPYIDISERSKKQDKFFVVDFLVHCSKGTYIRQLAEDIGEKMNMPASLIALRRKTIGSMTEKDVIDLDSINLKN
jgi:tRNA pseudouridine55 synthase